MIFAEFMMKRTSRRLFFHEMVDFPKGTRYSGGRVGKERSGRAPRDSKTIPNVLAKFSHFYNAPNSIFSQTFGGMHLFINIYWFFVRTEIAWPEKRTTENESYVRDMPCLYKQCGFFFLRQEQQTSRR